MSDKSSRSVSLQASELKPAFFMEYGVGSLQTSHRRAGVTIKIKTKLGQRCVSTIISQIGAYFDSDLRG